MEYGCGGSAYGDTGKVDRNLLQSLAMCGGKTDDVSAVECAKYQINASNERICRDAVRGVPLAVVPNGNLYRSNKPNDRFVAPTVSVNSCATQLLCGMCVCVCVFVDGLCKNALYGKCSSLGQFTLGMMTHNMPAHVRIVRI